MPPYFYVEHLLIFLNVVEEKCGANRNRRRKIVRNFSLLFWKQSFQTPKTIYWWFSCSPSWLSVPLYVFSAVQLSSHVWAILFRCIEQQFVWGFLYWNDGYTSNTHQTTRLRLQAKLAKNVRHACWFRSVLISQKEEKQLWRVQRWWDKKYIFMAQIRNAMRISEFLSVPADRKSIKIKHR